MFYCVFVTFLFGVLGQVGYLIVSIPDICLLTYFRITHDKAGGSLEYAGATLPVYNWRQGYVCIKI